MIVALPGLIFSLRSPSSGMRITGWLDPAQRSERIRWREHTLVVLSVEDLIVDRLCTAKFWDSATDHEQARIVYAAHHDRLDKARLRERASEERVGDLLTDLADDRPTDA